MDYKLGYLIFWKECNAESDCTIKGSRMVVSLKDNTKVAKKSNQITYWKNET